VTTTRHQVECAQHRRQVQQAATALLVQAEQVLSDLDHDRPTRADASTIIGDAARLAVQLELLRKAIEHAARMREAA
jgi:hypothetical protein